MAKNEEKYSEKIVKLYKNEKRAKNEKLFGNK